MPQQHQPPSPQQQHLTATGRDRLDLPGAALVVLLVLVLIATVLMVITNSAWAMKVAVIAGLWAALLGFFLVSSYRRRWEHEHTRAAAQQRLFESELAREKSAHHEKELQLQAEYQHRLNNLPAARKDEKMAVTSRDVASLERSLEALKNEVAALRTHLENLTGQLLSYEPEALTAQARRIEELEQATQLIEQAVNAEQQQAKQAPAPKVNAATEPTTGSIPVVEPEPAAAPEPAAHPQPAASWQPQVQVSQRAERSADKQAPARPAAPTFQTDTFAAVQWEPTGRHGAGEAPAANQSRGGRRRADDPDRQQWTAPQGSHRAGSGHHRSAEETASPAAAEQAQPRRRRRAAEQHANGVSVADLLQNLGK